MFSTQELFDFDLKRVFLQLLSIHPCLILFPHKGNSDLTLPTRLMISADISPMPPSAFSAHCNFTAHLFSHHFGQPLWVHSSCLCPSAYVVPGDELKKQDQGEFPIVHVLVIVPAVRKSRYTCSYCIYDFLPIDHVIGEGWGLNHVTGAVCIFIAIHVNSRSYPSSSTYFF